MNTEINMQVVVPSVVALILVWIVPVVNAALSDRLRHWEDAERLRRVSASACMVGVLFYLLIITSMLTLGEYTIAALERHFIAAAYNGIVWSVVNLCGMTYIYSKSPKGLE